MSTEKQITISDNVSFQSAFSVTPCLLYQTKKENANFETAKKIMMGDFSEKELVYKETITNAGVTCQYNLKKKTDEDKLVEVLKIQPITNETCYMSNNNDCLVGQFSVTVTPFNSLNIKNCSIEFDKRILEGKKELGRDAFIDGIRMYVLNMVNGRVLGKNQRNCSSSCKDVLYATIVKDDSSTENKIEPFVEFHKNDFGKNINRTATFYKYNDERIDKIVDDILNVLFSDNVGVYDKTEYTITIFVQQAKNKQVYPSQLFKNSSLSEKMKAKKNVNVKDNDKKTERDSEPREYYCHNGHIAITKDSVACGLRTIDIWYNEFNPSDSNYLANPIRVYGQNTNRLVAYRFKKIANSLDGTFNFDTDFFSILKKFILELKDIKQFGNHGVYLYFVMFFGVLANVKED